MTFELSDGDLKLLDAINELAPKKACNRFFFPSSRGKAEPEAVADYVIEKTIEHRCAFIYDEEESRFTHKWLKEDELLSIQTSYGVLVLPTRKLLITTLRYLIDIEH